MRKIIVSMMLSLDGFIEDAGGGIDWHAWNPEMDAYMLGFFEEADTLLFCRRTYELMAGYWPTEKAQSESPGIRAKMNNLPKIVFSKTLQQVKWPGTKLLHNLSNEEMQELKAMPGKNMIVFGGAALVNSLRELNLIDEYRLIINPVLLGSGKPFFQDVGAPTHLKLLHQQTFTCGNVLLCYQPQSPPA